MIPRLHDRSYCYLQAVWHSNYAANCYTVCCTKVPSPIIQHACVICLRYDPHDLEALVLQKCYTVPNRIRNSLDRRSCPKDGSTTQMFLGSEGIFVSLFCRSQEIRQNFCLRNILVAYLGNHDIISWLNKTISNFLIYGNLRVLQA